MVGPNPGLQLFDSIKAVRATKNDMALQVFLDKLFSDVLLSCKRLRNEKVVAELNGDAATPSPTPSSNLSSESGRQRMGTNIEIEGSSPDESARSTTPSSVPGGVPLPQPLVAELPMHRYTTLLFEYAAANSKENPKYTNKWVSLDVKRCEGVFNGKFGVGEARTYKDAKHIASKEICQILGIRQE